MDKLIWLGIGYIASKPKYRNFLLKNINKDLSEFIAEAQKEFLTGEKDESRIDKK